MARLNSLTLTLIDQPDGAVGYEVESYCPPKAPFTPAETLMMDLVYRIENQSEEEEPNENDSHDSPETSQEALQRGQGGPLGRVGGDNVIALQSRTERLKGIPDA